MKTASHRRPGFRLLELIVVIGIIILLAGLTMGAIFRVRESQMEKTSNEAVRKAQIAIEQQTKAAGDQIRSEFNSVPQPIKEMTRTQNGGYDAPRADALHGKLRLRQEFPQSFVEADRKRFLAAYPVFDPNVNPQLAPQLATYLPKAIFTVATQGLSNDTADNEAAMLLYLILSQGRGGVSFNVENIPTKTVTIGGAQVKVFVDAFDHPITFRRWADALDDPNTTAANYSTIDSVVGELSRPPLAPAKYPDPQDPDGRLGPLPTNTWPPQTRAAAIDALFISKVPNVRPVFNATQNPLDGLNRGPFVFSAGKDGVYLSFDDLYGFRLQQFGKGN